MSNLDRSTGSSAGSSASNRTLESLKKEAKRWLAALRDDDPAARVRLDRALPDAPLAPTLRDVQHALAREHGMPGWTALKLQVAEQASRAQHGMASFNRMVDALLEAYRTGTPEAMERHWALTWHRRAWSGMRAYVQLDLGRQVGDPDIERDITTEDARALVAREHGFSGWQEVVAFATSSATAPGVMLAKPVALLEPDVRGAPVRAGHTRAWQAVLAALEDPTVVGLDAGGQASDALLADLAPCTHVTSLSLGGSKQLTDAGVQVLAGLPALRHLDLSGTSITDSGMRALAGLHALETLSLAWTGVTDAGVASLAGCTALRSVDLQGTRSGDGALRALRNKPRLCDLRAGEAITDDGVLALQEYPVFKEWQGGEIEMALTSYDARPNYLLLRGGLTDRGLAALRGLDGLFALNIDARELPLTERGIASLVSLPRLGWLAADANDDSMPHIARMPRLQFLGAQDTTATDAGFEALGRSHSIEYIWGRRCHGLGDAGFTALSRMPALRSLSVSCKNVSDAGVSRLPAFPSLRELMPMDIPDAGYRHIGACRALERLVLMYCRDTSDAATEHLVEQLAELPALEYYFASYTRITDRTPELLSGIASLRSVTFDSCAGLTNDGIAKLARLPRLETVSVSGPNVSAAVARSFGEAVRVQVSR